MASVLEEMAENARLHAPSRAGRSGHSDNPKVDQPNMKTRSPASTSRDPGDGGHNSDIDAVADEDMNLGDEMEGNEQAETSRTAQTNADNAHSGNANANGAQPNDAAMKSTSDPEENPITVQARARLRARPRKRAQTPQDLESEEDDGMERNLMDYDESEGEDEIDSDVDMPKAHGRKSRSNPGSAKKQIKTVRDLPVYAQHAYVASTYGLPKFPMPMVVLPGLRSRKPPPIPIPDLTKRSRGRHVSNIEDDGRKYACNVAGCDKRFARGEHLKRHIRSIHTHEKPHQCPYPGCMRGFSRTDNMMQHMRTHDDWPDDEAAARMLAEVEKKTGKRIVPLTKDIQQLPMMMPPMPWQMHSMFANWNPPRGPGMNLMMPMPLAEDPSNKGEGTSSNLAGLLPPTTNGEIPDAETNYAVEGEEPFGSPVDKSTDQALDKSPSSPPLSPARPTISPAMIMMPNATASTSNNPATPAKSTQATKTSKKSTAGAAGAANAKPGENPAQSSSENGKFLQTAPVMSASAPMPGWPMPPGMQGMQSMQGFPYMPMPPLPPGLPFPPPAIAVPIPTGAPLPHPSQLPPNAQLVPNPAGGHTLIIPPPPPHTWGMLPPGMTNMMSMPPLPATSNPNPSSNSNPDPNPAQAQAQANTNGNRSSVDSETSTPATAPAE